MDPRVCPFQRWSVLHRSGYWAVRGWGSSVISPWEETGKAVDMAFWLHVWKMAKLYVLVEMLAQWSRCDPSKHLESSIHHRTPSVLPKIQHGLGTRNKVSWRIKLYSLYPLNTWPLYISHFLPLLSVLQAQTKALFGAEHFTKASQRYYWNRLFYSHPFRLIIPQTNRTPTTSTRLSSNFLFFSPATLLRRGGLWRCLLGKAWFGGHGTGGLSHCDLCFLFLLFLQIHTHTSH